MRRGSTPTHRFAVPLDLTDATVYITYQQNGKTVLEKTGSDLIVTEQYIDVPLTQDDTLAFSAEEVKIQLRYVCEDGTADASQIFRVPVKDVLKEDRIAWKSE